VRQFDGIETMVPNSLLLENKVTNWTGESPTMRRVVKVGVAYGSPTRQVADILQEAAAEHGLVLKDPTPMVIFEDFGENALIFALYFWVDLAKSSGMQIQSDLRFMLEKRLAEAGISISFPQRDVHVDSSRPLQVEVISGAASLSRAA
jgi:potassium efflux system protein